MTNKLRKTTSKISNKKVKIGLIGAGMIGDAHINAVRRDGRGEVAWIASRTEQTVQAKQKDFGIPNATTRYREMLKDPDLDAIIIAAPPFSHRAMLKEALEAGKHVLLEKPMATTREELDEIQNVVSRYPEKYVLECSCRHTRLQPKFQAIKELIDAGRIGEVYHIHHNALTRRTFIDWNPAGAWAHEKRLAGGGPIMDWGEYDFSFHLGLLDDVPQLKSVRSFARNGLKPLADKNFHSDVEEHSASWLEFDTGLTYYYERGSGVQAEIPNETRIFGTKGSLRFAFCSWESPEVDLFYLEDGQEKHRTFQVEIPKDHDDNFELIRHFLDVLIDGASPEMTVDLAAKHQEILFRILSAKE
jgi:predicted dehydrogenase